MAIKIDRKVTTEHRTVIVEFVLVAKDSAEDLLVRRFGDMVINPTGDFHDPINSSYPKFFVDAGPAVSFFERQSIRALFDDDALTVEDLQNRGRLWGDRIQEMIVAEMTRLRGLGIAFPNPTTTVTITI
jgi:hypothetical protein